MMTCIHAKVWLAAACGHPTSLHHHVIYDAIKNRVRNDQR